MQWLFASHNFRACRRQKHLNFQDDEPRQFPSISPALYKLVVALENRHLASYQELYKLSVDRRILAMLTSQGLGFWSSHPDYDDALFLLPIFIL